MTLDASSTRISTFPIQINLDPGQSTPFSTTITVPNSIVGGVYQLIAEVDDRNTIRAVATRTATTPLATR